MNSLKRKILIFCAILQFTYALILTISSLALIYNWLFIDSTESFAPYLFNGILNIFSQNILLTKIITPLVGLFLVTLLAATSKYIIKKPFDKKNNKFQNQFIFILVALITNVIFAIIFILLSLAEAKFFNIFLASATSLVAVLEFVAIFMPTKEALIVTKNNSNPDNNIATSNNRNSNTTTTASANTQSNKTIFSAIEIKERADELFRLAKNKSISEENLLICLNNLMDLPINDSYESKIKYLSRFSSHGFLTQSEISTLVYKALLTHNTASVKSRIRYAEFLYFKGLMTDEDYSNAIRKLMTITN